ncbi:hypothetical protein BT93_H0373 [Corymbia citriodora subsp. variegata]|nr:hypothetical protein BT93_H0373 [Corymbia citriodora subsp. variegata]
MAIETFRYVKRARVIFSFLEENTLSRTLMIVQLPKPSTVRLTCFLATSILVRRRLCLFHSASFLMIARPLLVERGVICSCSWMWTMKLFSSLEQSILIE